LRIDDAANLTDYLVGHAERTPGRPLFARRAGGGWVDIGAAEFQRQVIAVAAGLIAHGVQAGDRVALLSSTRYEWTLFDYAIWYAGAITVPIYETSSPEQIRWIISDSDVCWLVVETADHARSVEQVRPDLPQLRGLSVIDDGAVDELTTAGAEVDPEEVDKRRRSLTADTPATYIYTSGTTGRPRGCVLTHRNFLVQVQATTSHLPELLGGDGSTLLFLPLAHVFARILQVAGVSVGLRLGHSPGVAHVAEDLLTFRPTFLLAAPRVFEKVFNTATQRAHAGGRLKGKLFDAAVATGAAYSRATIDGGQPSAALRARQALFDRLVFAKLRASLGGRAAYAISGSAPLSDRLAHFYRGVGVEICEGWGLTETTAALTVNQPGHARVGTVGVPLPWTAVRVGEDGELQVKGGQVFAGYLGNPEATAETMTDDGWFRTGDLGRVDVDGYVTITGRKKEIIVTAGGKNVSPTQLEDVVAQHALVAQALVVGDNRPFIAALITLDPDMAAFWAKQHGKPADTASLVDDPDLRAEIDGAVAEANKLVSRAESIRRYELLPDEWTVEGGQLTPSLKIKRRVILAEAAERIDKLYADAKRERDAERSQSSS